MRACVFLPLLTAACLAACAAPGAEDEAAPKETVAPVVVIGATASPSAALPPETETAAKTADMPQSTPEPKPTPSLSVTTGRALDPARPFQPVLAVIDNAPAARPQTGLMQADIIYEISLDRTDHATRLIALFSDQDPARVGPVADARIPFFYLQREWNAMMIYLGYPADEGYPVYDQSLVDIPAAYSQGTARFFLLDKTVSSDPAYTQFCRLAEMKSELYGTTDVAAGRARFAFKTGVIAANSKPFIKVGLPFTSSDYAKTEFAYNADDNMLYRYERNSKGTLVQTKTLTPSETGAVTASEPLRVQNLIVQYVKYEDMTGPYRNAALISNGKCDYFINGRHAAGTWSRAGVDEPTVYQLRDGSRLTLEPGTTWIALQTLQRDVKVQYVA